MPTTRERRSDRHGASVPRPTRQCPGDEGHAAQLSRMCRIHNAKLFAVNVRTYVRPAQGARAGRSRRLRRGHRLSHHGGGSTTLLEPFWPGRRAHAFDEFCR